MSEITLTEGQIRALEALGYRALDGSAQGLFNPFYDSMNAQAVSQES